MKRLNPFMVYSAGWGGMVAGVILYLLLVGVFGIQQLHIHVKNGGMITLAFLIPSGFWYLVGNITESMDDF